MTDPLALLSSLNFLDDLNSEQDSHLRSVHHAEGTSGQPSNGTILVPRLFLDVDGVIAPTSSEPAQGAVVTWVQVFGSGSLHFRDDVVNRIGSLHERGVVAAEWLTSRQEVAPEVMAPALGLPPWPSNARRDAPEWWELPYETDFWKERFVYAALAAGERVVWCDDDIAFRAHHDELAVFGDNLLMVSPSASVGMTPEDMDIVEAWALGQQ